MQCGRASTSVRIRIGAGSAEQKTISSARVSGWRAVGGAVLGESDIQITSVVGEFYFCRVVGDTAKSKAHARARKKKSAGIFRRFLWWFTLPR